MKTDRVLVFIPVLNEEKTIKKIIDEISLTYPNWDILVVDDGSTDATIKEAQKTKATVIPLLINSEGVGTVLTALMIASRSKYDYMVKIDGDGQQEVSVLKQLVQTLKENNVDIAVGSRYLKKTEETDSFIKVIGRVMSSGLINFKLRGKNKITDCTSGIRAWNSKSIMKLNEIYSRQNLGNGSVFWIREAFIASDNGLKIQEIPAFYFERKHGKSKSFSISNMWTFPFRLGLILIS